jgi:hypothetical protein
MSSTAIIGGGPLQRHLPGEPDAAGAGVVERLFDRGRLSSQFTRMICLQQYKCNQVVCIPTNIHLPVQDIAGEKGRCKEQLALHAPAAPCHAPVRPDLSSARRRHRGGIGAEGGVGCVSGERHCEIKSLSVNP